MSKFLLITKINLLSFFDIKRVTNSKYKSERKRNVSKVLLLLFIFLYLSFYVFEMVDYVMAGFISINKPIYALGFLFTSISLFILFSNVFKVKSILFDFKDYDLLMSLPIKRNIIIASKLTSLYLLNLLYTIIVMIPGFLAYIKYATLSSNILYFLILFIIPVVPLLLSLIIGIIISWITSKFKNKKIGSYIVNFSLIIFFLMISFKLNNNDISVLANNEINVVNKVKSFYPLTSIFINLLSDFNILDLIIYFIVPIIMLFLFQVLLNKMYISIRSKLLKTNVRNDYKIKMYHHSSSLTSLYKKELKKFTSNSLYVLNTTFGCVLLIILIFSIIVFKDDTIARFFEIDDLSSMLRMYIIFIISLLCVMSSTTHPSISLEGKSLWIIKMLPVSSDKIFISKVLVNLTILVPTILISGTFFGIYLHFTYQEFILIYLMPLGYSLFTSIIGLIFNLLYPRFDFENEIKVIKQSLPAFLTIFVGIISVIIPLSLGNITVNYLTLVTLSILLVDIILVIILHFYGKYKLIKL